MNGAHDIKNSQTYTFAIQNATPKPITTAPARKKTLVLEAFRVQTNKPAWSPC